MAFQNDRSIAGAVRARLEEAARNIHCTEEIEIDSNPMISLGDDGAWVQGWLFVPRDDYEDLL